MTTSAAKGGKLIALTFDDGPSGYTNGLLDGLAARNVKVTFFMLGMCAQSYPSVVRRAYNEGHQIAQHTYDHPALTTKSNEQIAWQLQKTDSILDNILGEDNDYLLRTPYGDYNDRVLSQIGSPNIVWSVDSCDWQLLNAEKVCNQIVNNAFDGAIVLVHDIHRTSIPGALKAIDILLSWGYEFVTVGELFRRRGVTMNNGVNYYSCKPNGTDYGPLTEPTVSYKNGKITFSNIPGGASLYYTTDCSVPTKNSALYSKPIPLTSGTVRYRVVAKYARTPVRTLTITENGNMFQDVMTNEWFYDEVDRAVTLGIFEGTGNYCFEPNKNLTRAMFVTVLYRLMQTFGKDTTVSGTSCFDDATGKWYKDAVLWANENGIVTGYQDGTFRPDKTISREEMCVILARTLSWLGVQMQEKPLNFTDNDKISAWAKQSVALVSGAGLILGNSDRSFAPDKAANRAEGATIMLRLYDLLK